MKTLETFLTLLILLPAFALAHQDRIFTLTSDGSIPELPAEYSGTRVRIGFSSDSIPILKSFSVISGGKENVLPDCLLKLVSTHQIDSVSLTGSWYHDEGMSLPPYVSIRFYDPNAASVPWGIPGIYFLFSLRDASLLSVERVTYDPVVKAGKRTNIELSDRCPIVK